MWLWLGVSLGLRDVPSHHLPTFLAVGRVDSLILENGSVQDATASSTSSRFRILTSGSGERGKDTNSESRTWRNTWGDTKSLGKAMGLFVGWVIGVSQNILEIECDTWSHDLCTSLRPVRTQSTYKTWYLPSSSLQPRWVPNKWSSDTRQRMPSAYRRRRRGAPAPGRAAIAWAGLGKLRRRGATWIKCWQMRSEMLLLSFFFLPLSANSEVLENPRVLTEFLRFRGDLCWQSLHKCLKGQFLERYF